MLKKCKKLRFNLQLKILIYMFRGALNPLRTDPTASLNFHSTVDEFAQYKRRIQQLKGYH